MGEKGPVSLLILSTHARCHFRFWRKFRKILVHVPHAGQSPGSRPLSPGEGMRLCHPWSPSFLSTPPMVYNKVSVLTKPLLPF